MQLSMSGKRNAKLIDSVFPCCQFSSHADVRGLRHMKLIGRGDVDRVASRSDKENARIAAAEWLGHVQRVTRMNLSDLARQSHVAPSTLYRAANDPDHQHVLSTTTIAKISKVTGVPPPNVLRPGESAQPGIEEAIRFKSGKSGQLTLALIERGLNGDPELESWRLQTRALELAGYLPGDLIILDPHADPRPGDLVAADTYDIERDRQATIWRLFNPPYLVAASSDLRLIKPRLLDGAVIRGVALVSFRPRVAA